MNDTMSLVLAGAILAAGGAGLCMYKFSDSTNSDDGEYNEDSWFSSNDKEDKNEKDEEKDKDEDKYKDSLESKDFKTKSRSGKTKRNKRGSGTKRRY
jgi:hypothetical protein